MESGQQNHNQRQIQPCQLHNQNLHRSHQTPNGRSLSTKYESLDYDLIENVIFLEDQHKPNSHRFVSRDIQKILAIFLIAFATACSGFFASISVNILTHIKFSKIISSSEYYCNSANNTSEPPSQLAIVRCLLPSYFIWIAWNVLPSLFGSVLVTYMAPVAAGSGIPVVKCYLNGVRIPEVVQFKTFVAKLLGVISSVVGGLAVGKEGPFIHCGAVLGAGISQGKSSTLKFDTKLFKSFQNDRDKRDFVSAGASAGVAAAFGAPIGGVLFALEEGASFWNQALTWRIFFCSMMTSFMLNLFMVTFTHNTGILAFYSLVNFGLVEELDYFWFEIPIFICIAIAGGAIGSSFCYVNLLITKWRKRFIVQEYSKVLEVIVVAIMTATIGMLLIIFASECRDLPTTMLNQTTARSLQDNYDNIMQRVWDFWTSEGSRRDLDPFIYNPDNEAKKALDNHIFTSICPPKQFSAMSALWLKTSEGVSSTFMVLQEDLWSMRTLGIFLISYYTLALITYGLSISSGVFIPSLLVGATGGRLVGLILRELFGLQPWLKNLNKFAIIGAVSVLGGVVRMTISLTVIIIEATGCISFGLPIMICLIVSKWVADSFIEGLYDIAIQQADVPFLEWEPPSRSYSIYASMVMSPHVKVLRSTETVADLINILKSNSHNGFPVVDIEFPNPFNTQHISQRSDRFDTSPTGHNNNLTRRTESSESRLSSSDTQALVNNDHLNDDFLIGSFQRCSITPRRESFGRYRGLVLRWQILVMLHLKIFNENERSYEMLKLESFQNFYPRYPTMEEVVENLTPEMYNYHVDLRSIMNTAAYTVSYAASFPKIYHLFRSLGLRHLVVIDDRNQVVGMITRKDLARYVKERDENGILRFNELRYS